MKKLIIVLLAAMLSLSCSDFREEFSPVFDHQLKIGQVDLNEKSIMINIVVDSAEFRMMYENPQEEIEIYGLFQLYRSQKLVFERDNTRFKLKGGASLYSDLKTLGIRFAQPQDNASGALLSPPDVLPFHQLERIESLRLRNSGGDFRIIRDGTMIKDIAYTQLAIRAGLDIDVMYAEQAAVFINEHFYGLLNLRSESTARGIAGLYEADPDQISLAKIFFTQTDVIVERQNGDYQRISKLIEAIDNKNLNYLRNHIDIANFIDYIVFQTYIANWDWPHNNVKIYAIGDSKFRFFMYDLDEGNRLFLNREPLAFLDLSRKNPVADLFHTLYKEDDFRQSFDARYRYLLESGKLDAEVFKSITNRYYKNIETLMPYQIEKYGQPRTLAEWYRNIEILNANFQKREKNVRKYILQ